MAITNLGNVAIVPKGAWVSTSTYVKNNLVSYSNGNSYVAVQDVPTGTLPTDTEYWMLSGQKGTDGDVTTSAMNDAIEYAVNTLDTDLQGQIDSLDTRIDVTETEITPIERGGTFANNAVDGLANLGGMPFSVITTPTDLDTITTSGVYGIKFTLSGYNAPISNWGVLTCMSAASTGTMYQIYQPDNLPVQYFRKYSSSAWQDWQLIGEETFSQLDHSHALTDSSITGVTPIEKGGTGESTISDILTSFGLESISTTTPDTPSSIGTIDYFRVYKQGNIVVFNVRYESSFTSGIKTESAIIPLEYRPVDNYVGLSGYTSDTSNLLQAYSTSSGIIKIRLSEATTDIILSGSWITS